MKILVHHQRLTNFKSQLTLLKFNYVLINHHLFGNQLEKEIYVSLKCYFIRNKSIFEFVCFYSVVPELLAWHPRLLLEANNSDREWKFPFWICHLQAIPRAWKILSGIYEPVPICQNPMIRRCPDEALAHLLPASTHDCLQTNLKWNRTYNQSNISSVILI